MSDTLEHTVDTIIDHIKKDVHNKVVCIHKDMRRVKGHVPCRNEKKVVEKIVQEIRRNREHILTRSRKGILILWSGYDKGMLRVALRLSTEIKNCPLELSNISDDLDRLYGDWEEEMKRIGDEFHIRSKESISKIRKGVWDRISTMWASRNVSHCVVVLSDEIDMEKILFKHEIPVLKKNVKIAFLVSNCDTGEVEPLYLNGKHLFLSKKGAKRVIRERFESMVTEEQLTHTFG